MSKHVLVPLDGSPLAEADLPQAGSIARAMSGTLLLVRAEPDVMATSLMVGVIPVTPQIWELYEHEPQIAGEYLAEVAGRLRAEGLMVETKVLRGDPARAIVQHAASHPEVRLIAMSTHARTGLGRLMLGSVAEGVLHDTPVPLLLVHPQKDDGTHDWAPAAPVRKIVVPLDGSPFAEQALTQATSLAADTEAGLLLFTVLADEYDTVTTETSEGRERLVAPWEGEAAWAVEYLSEVAGRPELANTAVEMRSAWGEPAEEILKAIEREEADMVVMSTHGRGGLARLLMGSVAMKVVQRSPRVVLLVNSKERVRESAPSPVARGLAPHSL